ncbi:MAG: transporter substrate-binding domain-containing protein [Alphaproteobacteria bacterium]|nr:transporter substrate-binding domain-containing protein [Alphaproteobacteria bacterium]
MNRRDLGRLVGVGAAVAGATLASTPRLAQAQGAAKSRLAQILERGTMRVGTTGDFNPMSFRDPGSNEYRGFDIESMQQLAADMGVKIEWVPTEWATLVAGIAAGRFDIFSGASVSMARAKTAAFSVPYIELGTVPLALKPNAGKFASWESINDPGVRVAVFMGTVFEEQAKQHFPKAQLRSIQAPATGFQEVLAGRADVTITSTIEASTLVRRFDSLTLLGDNVRPRNRRPLAFVVAQDEPTWLNNVNTWVTLRRIDGFFDALEAKWLPKS